MATYVRKSALKEIEKTPSLSDRAYEQIKDAIIMNQLRPGEVLAEEQLADRLSISRTPLRSALKQLVFEHIAEIGDSKNVIVSNVTLQDIGNVSVVRCALEPLAISLMENNITKRQIRSLYHLIEKQKNSRTHAEKLENEYLFHTQLALCSRNTFLSDMIEKINLTFRRFLTLSGTFDKYEQAAIGEHEKVVANLEVGNFKEAEKAMLLHVKNVQERILI